MRRHFILVLGFCLFGIIGCSNDKIDPGKLKKKFYTLQQVLDNLVAELRYDSAFDLKKRACESCGLVLNRNDFNDKIAKVFESAGIKTVFTFHWSCVKPSPKQFDFETNWDNSLPVHLTYNSCDTTETIKGFYRKDKNLNEFWGLGNNWTIWIERKLIDAKQ